MPRGDWGSVPVPNDLIKAVDKIVDEDKYPTGKWHSRSHFIIEAVKEKLSREEKEEKKQ